MAETLTQPRTKTERESRGRIIIEVADEHNCNHTWGPTKDILRGRWAKANVPGQNINEIVDAIPDIPGIWIIVDPSRKQVQLLDPLTLPEYADLMTRVKTLRLGETRVQNIENGPVKFPPAKEVGDSEIKTWLFRMRQKLNTKQAIEIAGTVPTYEEIKEMPGKTGIEFFNSSSRACRFLEDQEAHDAKLEDKMK